MGLNQLKSNPNVALTVGALNANNSTGSTGQYLESTGTGTRWTSINLSTFTSLSVSGISTLGTVQVSSGIVTATSGVVTYYGDGSRLTGISAVGIGSQWVTTSAGIHTRSNVGIGTTNPTSNIHIGSGTTTISPLQINSGSLLTIPQVGAIEYDGTTFYATPNQTSGRGILSSQSYYRIGNTAITGNTGTSAQNALGVLANVNSSTVYQFEYLLAFSKPTGTTTHNFAFRFLNGTATVNNIFLHRVLFAPLYDSSVYTGTTTSYLTTFTYTNVVQAPVTIIAVVRGTFGIATGGTIGPQYTLSTNPGGAYSTISGSYFSIWPIGNGTSNLSVGQWT
jgi:hypothetical protein